MPEWRHTSPQLCWAGLHCPDWPSPSVFPAAPPAPCCSSLAPAEVRTAAPAPFAAESTALPPSHSQIASNALSLPAELSLNWLSGPMSGGETHRNRKWSQNKQMASSVTGNIHPEKKSLSPHRAELVIAGCYLKMSMQDFFLNFFIKMSSYLLSVLQCRLHPCNLSHLLFQISFHFLHLKLLLFQLYKINTGHSNLSYRWLSILQS